jgi:hypothetical protein
MPFYNLDESVLIISRCESEKELTKIGHTLETYKRLFTVEECWLLTHTIKLQLDLIRLLNRMKE